MRQTLQAAAITMIAASCWTIVSQGALFKLPRPLNGYSNASASRYPRLRQSMPSAIDWYPPTDSQSTSHLALLPVRH
jgi:hypothetical protein